MTTDRSEGWDEVADEFMVVRTGIGADLVRRWAREHLGPSASIVDVGCGSGVPIAEALVDDGFQVFGIDASPTLIAAFRRRLPDAVAVCEPAQDSVFFNRSFDAAIAVGLLFLLGEEDQARVIHRVAGALRPGGRFLFSAPVEACEWPDTLTGRPSRSLGAEEYERLIGLSGLRLVGRQADEGGNNYFDCLKT